ncbi:hypothetical protein GUITHDRAFT_133791 [Guillardia theta CCMP2712]|uniref:Mediator of RNA polymerase II transcription subunit 4 n=2 Tax=Guillardia theta TaxID=55529 RepID=L1JV04_GUITC|nr:hypothetical protein GUITHDRAFT_133791 [Guillardia theta CCMP2712]EKX52040.1 hypothetical protein GUITHDRAFT_133791 [Guillardia theta CCMP2712]|mmetsp:Transcript_50447/g.157543  ORF Transcript_50447/g.157543 Transcript_50447/m.157543 type:complete len:325 (+) Transcript_50447:351-1325(+)|eukprot:XP_005839020.1 hypothetical protein GUITHDRAFT_133791 [Guillardia theta CCMP2712]
MSGQPSALQNVRTNLKARAVSNLTKMRDVAKEIFRNLQHTSKTAKEEVEKFESLTNQRDGLLHLLCSFQVELRENVAELNKIVEVKKKIDDVKSKIDDSDAALKTFGRSLKDAAGVLQEALKTSSNTERVVEVEVEDLIKYAHVISYTSSAQEGWEPNTPLVGALPPAPHSDVMARSRLFSAVRPKRVEREPVQSSSAVIQLDLSEAMAASQVDTNLGKRQSPEDEMEEKMLKIWNYPLQDAEQEKSEADAEDKEDEVMKEPARPRKKQFVIQPFSMCIKESSWKEKNIQVLGDLDENFNCAVTMPEMPAMWRPGDPVVITPED